MSGTLNGGGSAGGGTFSIANGQIYAPDGSLFHEIETSGPASQAARLGEAAGQAIRDKAGAGFFESWN